MPETKRLGLRAAAVELQISHVALLKAAKTGRVPRGEDGLFDVEQCRAELAKNSHPGKQRSARAQQKQIHVVPSAPATEPIAEGPVAPTPRVSVGIADPTDEADYEVPADDTDLKNFEYNKLLCERERLKIADARLNLRVKQGELVPLVEINAHIASMILRARETLTRMGPDLRDQLAETLDPIECDRIVSAQIRQGLQQLSEYVPPE